ncbi:MULTISPECIES: hypothetical protein [unclassified Streptomyces]|uniref:hypothetical protein n=1 Tax=unclassified Streptomyces TaxID=2593676 RepID=UPI000CD4B117|nr:MULTISPECIES: hypothetical protein [unclassified Streptomyces]
MIAVVTVTASLVLVPAAVAHAGRGSIDEKVNGGKSHNRIWGEASFQGVIIDPPSSSDGGSFTPKQAANWEPPPCYYGPYWKASEFKAWWEGYAEPFAHRTETSEAATDIIDRHNQKYGPDSRYADHNIDKEEDGAWWWVHTNPDSSDREGRWACGQDFFWVDHGDVPDPGPGVPDALTLAELAYAHVDVPELEFGLSPVAAAQKVNLSTWVWVPEAELAPVSVTARLDGYAALSSTVTATPVSLTIDPGTDDAVVHAGSGGCAVSSSGAIGERWESSKAGLTPPCGVTYGRATHDGGSYALSATVTWEVSWSGSDGSGGDLPAGEFASTQDVQVQEVQTVVR